MKKSTFSCNPSINKGLYLKKSFAQGGGGISPMAMICLKKSTRTDLY